ncbi:DNA phosphorothioation system sulfurtransferase DndC [Halomonas heilongjiangensis]|uniref:DNA phosphorothioation system sulfurtransferase DndC n=1 Tax=Halomonas heilongjiangensis TaxID=1387883 RepID=A0A2N7TQD6_9GAMM|nr:DNA phosphorothioation system sulfurtransferase DndC [Halomonas heilongjiangensis]PMR70410.1 DNA phosphorothioation system sulfurtransferase DndC [Halomonas heilongjiangensis]PXX91370.1 DNA phosphorothioation system sulfurtransferase DndC [Halomonas heilongjiangensis]
MTTQEQFIYPDHVSMIKETTISGRPLVDLVGEVQRIYTSDDRPWIIGFSGGKDSTCVLSLVYTALIELPPEQRTKHIYVVSSDTLVETPVVVDMIQRVLKDINEAAACEQLPISAHSVEPKTDQTFWVNLIGRGYPAPNQTFRWCTERMKIDPVSEFILETVAQFGETVVVLGSRSQESASRAQVIAKHKIDGSALSRHSSLPNAYTYMPIESWSADDVWMYLMSAPCPWGGSNRELFELYKGSNQGECPLVIDKSTPSCGNSRFGCWTCTVVTDDKALHGLIESGATWMEPLLKFRNKLYDSRQPHNAEEYRNFRRRTGRVSYNSGDINDDSVKDVRHIPGPYWLSKRKEFLQELLEIEKQINEGGEAIELITRPELHMIRREWLRDPNEPDWEDSLPGIYRAVYGEDLDWIEDDAGAFTKADSSTLEALSEKYNVPAALVRKMLEAELQVSGLGNRRGILNKLESILQRDWEALEVINERNESFRKRGKSHVEEIKHEFAEFLQ